MKTIEEVWSDIRGFPDYEVSSAGRIHNRRVGIIMRTSLTNHGHVKITLVDYRGVRLTRSVARLVAEAFVRPPNVLSDQIVVLDGDFSNVTSENLAWRPRWFAWKYTRQLKTKQPIYYQNLPVVNVEENIEYPSIISAGMHEGLLFEDIWQSTFTGRKVYPTGAIFEVAEMDDFD